MSSTKLIQGYVISCWLMDTYTETILEIDSSCFDGEFQEIAKTIKEEYLSKSKVDMLFLGFDFERLNGIIGEYLFLSYNIQTCVEKLNEYKTEKYSKAVAQKLLTGEISTLQAIGMLNNNLSGEATESDTGDILAAETYIKIVEKSERKSILSTRYRSLDRLIGDFSETGFFVLGGRPSSGKTVLALNLADNLARQDKKVLIYSLEMPKHDIMKRIVVSNTNVNNERLKNNTLSKEDFEILARSAKMEHLKNIHIIDDSKMSIDQIITKSIALHRKHDYAAIFVDYLQLVSAEGSSIREKMINVSHGFVSLKKAINIPIVVVSSLSRAAASRSEKQPIMSDLAEAGAIEFDADTIAFVYREFMEDNEKDPRQSEIIFRKQRDGNLGIAKLCFRGEHFRFSEWQMPPK